jgi:hypothetical protein
MDQSMTTREPSEKSLEIMGGGSNPAPDWSHEKISAALKGLTRERQMEIEAEEDAEWAKRLGGAKILFPENDL